MKRIILLQVTFSLFITNISAQSVSTNREIYNYDVGDIFHYSHEMSGPSGGANITSNVEIIGKYYSLVQDTIFYIRDIVTKQSGNGIPLSYNYIIDTINYTNLDSAVNNGIIDSVYNDITKYNGRKINRDTISVLDLYVDSLGKVFDFIYHDFNYMTQNLERLIYYKKGSEDWGTPIFLGIHETLEKQSRIKIYPNPTSDFISIDLGEIQKSEFEIEIYNITGKKVKSLKFTPIAIGGKSSAEVSVKDFPHGLYLGKVILNNGEIKSFKFIVE